jgi:cysteine desulfuration protein SufE
VTLPARLEARLDYLDALDRAERIQALVDLAARFRPVPAAVATRPYPATHRVPGCESEAYAWALPNPDGTLRFQYAVENPQGISAMALAAILADALSGAPLADVAEVPADIVYRIFGRELSMGKSLGLMGLVHMARAAARERLAQREPPSVGPAGPEARERIEAPGA